MDSTDEEESRGSCKFCKFAAVQGGAELVIVRISVYFWPSRIGAGRGAVSVVSVLF